MGSDAEEFKPERWFNLPEKYDRTFSHGHFHRRCTRLYRTHDELIGDESRNLPLGIPLQFEPFEGAISIMDTLITMKPQGGLPLKVSKV